VQGRRGLNPRGASAEAKAQELRGQPFNIVDHNCEHDTYHVLTAYGARLPHPGQPQNLTPLAWFHHVPGTAYSLQDAPAPDGMAASRLE